MSLSPWSSGRGTDVVGTLNAFLWGLTLGISALLDGHFTNQIKAKLVREVRKTISHKKHWYLEVYLSFTIIAASSAPSTLVKSERQ